MLDDPEILKTKIIDTTNLLPVATITPPLHINITPTAALAPIEPHPFSTLATIEPSIITAPGYNNPTTRTIDTEAVPLPWSLAGEFTIDILQHIVRKEKVRENLNARYNEGQAVRGKSKRRIRR